MRTCQVFRSTLAFFILTCLLCPAFAEPFYSEFGYQLSPPRNWQTDTSGQPTIDLAVKAPRDHNFSANLVVTITQLPGQVSAEQILSQVPTLQKRMLRNYKVIRKGILAIGNDRAISIIATHTGPDSGKRLWMRQVIIPHNGRLYSLTCTALESTRKKYEPVFSSLLKTFRWSE